MKHLLLKASLVTLVVASLTSCSDKKTSSVISTEPHPNTPPPSVATTVATKDTSLQKTPTQQKIFDIKKSLPIPGQQLIDRIEVCDHLAGEINGIPSEDVETVRSMNEFNCKDLENDLASVTDPSTLEAVRQSKKILEEQFQE